MALTTSEVRLAPEGSVWVAPVGTTEPTNTSTAWATVDADWLDFGYISEDGVSLTPSVDTNSIRAWQSLHDLKRPIVGVEFEVSFVPMQVNQTTVGVYFLGEEDGFTNVGGTTGRLEIPNSPGTQERALGIEWTDDEGDVNRLVIPRAQITDREALQLQRPEALTFGVTFVALAGPAGYMGVLLSDNVDLIPAT
jgi:hypothetical protein